MITGRCFVKNIKIVSKLLNDKKDSNLHSTLEIEENKLNKEFIFPDNLSIIGEIIDDYSKTCRNSKVKVKVLGNGNI